MAQRQPAGPRVGLIGAGFMGAVHARAWAAIGVPPAAILARSGDAPAFASDAEVCSDLDAFLDRVDVVDVCTPTDTHVDLALAAAAAGRPTLCEKPLALDEQQALDVVAAFERAGVVLQVAHVVRFMPEYAGLKAAVQRGDVGDPAVLRLARLSFAPERGSASWFADEQRSGGLFFDLMIHDLDVARWIAGDVKTVYARASGGPRSYGIAILTHTSGAITHVEASWAEPAPVFRTRLEIAGSRGIIAFDSDDTVPYVARLHREGAVANTALADTGLAADPFEAELRHFLDVVAGRREPIITPLDAVAAVRLAAAARVSARDGAPVPVRPIGTRS